MTASISVKAGPVNNSMRRAALAYVVPDFANPTGETLSEAQRLRLLDLAAEANIHVIEDAAYQALRFEGDSVPSCLALDIRQCGHIDRSRIIYCGTFSKTLARGLRTGWVCASREVIRKIILIKQAADLHCSTFNQMIILGVAEPLYPQQVGSSSPSTACDATQWLRRSPRIWLAV